jgi:hypothetical protein
MAWLKISTSIGPVYHHGARHQRILIRYRPIVNVESHYAPRSPGDLGVQVGVPPYVVDVYTHPYLRRAGPACRSPGTGSRRPTAPPRTRGVAALLRALPHSARRPVLFARCPPQPWPGWRRYRTRAPPRPAVTRLRRPVRRPPPPRGGCRRGVLASRPRSRLETRRPNFRTTRAASGKPISATLSRRSAILGTPAQRQPSTASRRLQRLVVIWLRLRRERSAWV